MKLFRRFKELYLKIVTRLGYQFSYFPECSGIYGNRILALFLSLFFGVSAFFLMCFLDFAGLFGENPNSSSTITSIFIGCVSMLASSIGLVVAAFVFLNDSLKEQAGRDSTLQYIITAVSKKKIEELVWVSVFSIVAIVGSLYSNINLEKCFCLSIKLCDKQICFTGSQLFYGCVSLCVALLTYIIIFACGMIDSERVIQITARMVEREYRRKIIKAIRKRKKQNKKRKDDRITKFRYEFENAVCKINGNDTCKDLYDILVKYTNDPEIYTFDEPTCQLSAEQFTVQYIKDVNQIETELKALCDNNIEPNSTSQIDRMKRGFLWYFGVNSQLGISTEYQKKMRYENVLRSTYDYYVIKCDTSLTAQTKIWERIKQNRQPLSASESDFFCITLQTIINSFFEYYELLVRYKEALIHVDKKYYNHWVKYADNKKSTTFLWNIYLLEREELKVLLNYFLSFARLTNLSLGSSRMNQACLTNSDFTNSCYINSNFQSAHLENTIFKDSDLSCTNCANVYAIQADFRGSNLSHAYFAGARLIDANLSNCVMDEIAFRSKKLTNINDFSCFDIELKKLHSSIVSSVQTKLQSETEKRCIVRKVSDMNLFDESQAINRTKKCLEELFEQYTSNKISSIEKFRSTLSEVETLLKRKASEEFPVDYVVACLTNATINNSLMRQVDLSSMHLEGASFIDSIMTSMIAINSNAVGTVFLKANLKESIFGRTNLKEAIFDEANMYNAKFINVNASKASFCHTSMAKVVIVNDQDSFSVSYYMLNRTAKIKNLQCSWTNLAMKQTIAIDALIFNVCMDETNFNETIFKRAVIYNTMMRWSSLVECDLSYTMLIGCTFFQSDFSNALLSKSVLFACDFSNANMGNIKLIGGTAEKCVFHATTFKDANLSDLTFCDCYFEDVSFEDAYSSNTQFKRCVFKKMSIPKNRIKNKSLHRCKYWNHSIYIDIDQNLYIDVLFSDV